MRRLRGYGYIFWIFLLDRGSASGKDASMAPASRVDGVFPPAPHLTLPFDSNGIALFLIATALLILSATLLYLFNRRLRKKLKAQTQLIVENQARLQESFKMSRDIIYKTHLTTMSYVYVSPAAESILGYRADRILSGGMARTFELLHPDDVPPARAHMEAVQFANPAEGADLTIEYRLKAKDGRYVWFSDRHVVLFDKEGHPEYLIGNARDITDIKRSEMARLESQEKYRNLFESSPDGIALVDLDGYFIEANRSLQRLTGHEGAELLARSYLDITPTRYHSAQKEAVERLKQGIPQKKPFEKEYIRKDGSRIPISVQAWPVRDAENRIIAIGAFIKDLQKEKSLAEENALLEGQLRHTQKMEAMGTLAGGIAHDFNNILGGIIGCTENLQREIPDSLPPCREHLDHITGACQRAKELVRQILDFSRQGSSRIQPVDLSAVAGEVLDLMRATLPKSIEIQENISLASARTLADPSQIHQVLMNLCTNAYQAMAQHGGRLTVALEQVRWNVDRQFRTGKLPAGAYLALKVQDTGCGISPENLERIFDPYFTTKTPEHGTGLGLSVTLGIVKNHNGAIEVRRSVSGTTFTVYLPAAAPSPATAVLEQEADTPGGDEHILFVDDEAILVKSIRNTLKYLGYQVTTTERSTEALDLFRRSPESFDLVITDQNMPHMNGMELASHVSSIRPSLPIILCTGFSKDDGAKAAAKCGVSKFLLKPIGTRDLALAIREVLDTSPLN